MRNKGVIVSIIFIIAFVFIILIVQHKNLIEIGNEYSVKVKEVLADDKEIEKKWIIDKNKIPFNLGNAEVFEIEQTYICFSPEIRVRKINNGRAYSFAVKTNMSSDGLIRNEMEEYITEEQYNNLINKKEGNTIHKTRYQLLYNNNIYVIDIFKGQLEGLAYLEIEFASEEEANKFITPEWVIKDVTNDIRYKNGYLARYGIPN